MNNYHNYDDESFVTWKSGQDFFREKNSNWYWIFLIITAIIIFIVYFFNIGGSASSRGGNVILIVLIAISSLTIIMASIVQPKKNIYTLSTYSIHSTDWAREIQLSSFLSYRIDFDTKELILKRDSLAHPVLVVPLSPLVSLKKIQTILETKLVFDNDLKNPQLETNIKKILGV